MTAVSSILNMGPVADSEFARAGITSAEEVRNLGPDAAYATLLRAGLRPHFIGYYALVMGLQGRPWNDCKGAEKEALRIKFDALKADTKSEIPTGIEAELNRLGVTGR